MHFIRTFGSILYGFATLGGLLILLALAHLRGEPTPGGFEVEPWA